MRRLRLSSLLSCLLVLATCSVGVRASDTQELFIKAALVYKFAGFVVVQGNGPLGDSVVTVAKIGDANSDPDFDTFAASDPEGPELRYSHLQSIESAPAEPILYISRSEQERLAETLGVLGDEPVLTVSDIEGFCERGGMIELYKRRNRIRFKINVDAVDAAGLKVSPHLLKLAEIVREGE